MMIIDGQADFRSLLMHHVTTHWPDAIISAYDPTEAGYLPDEFSGAGNDIILLGSRHGDRDGVDVLRRFMKKEKFPPVVYFGTEEDEAEARKIGPNAHFIREHIHHDSLIVGLSNVLVAGERVASTTSLFVGDMRTGIHPLIKGYRMILVMPENMSLERRAVMLAYGAEILLVSREEGMEGARDLATAMQRDGKCRVLDQFSNPDNPRAHYEGTGPEIWRDTEGTVTHFVSAMGTTGTIMGTSRYLKEMNPDIQIVGVQPAQGASIPGIRRWPEAYLPSIFEASRVDRTIDIAQDEAENTTRALAAREGIFCGISSGGAVAAALKLDAEVEKAVIVAIICDRGDRYLSTGVFPD